MDKKERNLVKKALKKELSRIIGNRSGCSATFKPETNTWEVWMSVDFDVPPEWSARKNGMEEDIQNPNVVSYMKEQENQIVSALKERFSAEYQPEKENDFNFTIPFPPMFSVKRENGVLRLKTKEEKEQDKINFPELANMIQKDEELMKAGFFEFRGEEGITEYDGFVLVKYAGLRARYTFILPHEKVAV